MSTFTKKDLRSTLTLLLKALGAAGVPGGEVAADAVKAAADRLDARRARQALQEALEKADNAFRADARGRGWGDLADAVLQLPIHNLSAFEAALHAALAAGDPAALHAELTRQFTAIYGEQDAEAAAEAARLYAARVLDAVWSVPAFRDAARDILFRQQHEALQRLIALVERLPRWWRLTPALQPRPKSALVVGERHDIPLTALKAPVRLVPFVGRERERDALKTWAKALAEAPARAGLRVVTGPGGMGKTRLAVETAAALSAEGWEAFFLPSEPLRGGTDPAHLNPAAEAWFTPPRPTLYILDYAEQIAPERLRALLATLHATAARRAHPVALLFLMRPAPEPGWVDEVASLTGADVAFAEWLRRAIAPALQNPLRLRELAPADLPRLFAAARRTFVELRGQAPEREITYDAADLPARPLAVVLLGLLAAYGHRVARSASEQAVLENLWERWEKDKWRRTLRDRGLPEGWMPDALRMIETALVVATMGRQFHSPQELAAFWEAHDPPRYPKPNGETLAPRWLAAQMRLLFPAVEGGLAPAIVPDPLADFVLARRQDLPALARAALPVADEIRRADRAAVEQDVSISQILQSTPGEALFPLAWPLGLLPLLLRLREAYPRAGRALAEALANWLEAAAGELYRADPAAAARWLDLWEAALPDHPDRTPVAWREVFAAYCQARLAASGDEADKAMWQGNLSVALSALGERKKALTAAEEAARLYRRLAEQNPQAYEPYLALSLSNLGNILSDLGRREEALAAVEEAAGLYRRLAAQNPQAYAPDLALSLNNLARSLADLGHREEALAAAEEAVAIRRRLASQNPQAYAPDLALSLNNLARSLADLGRREDALSAAEEAVGLYRRLAKQNPQAYASDLAMSLNNLARSLSDLGRREEALAAAEEAVGVYRRLAAQNPQAYAPYLAASLNNLAAMLSDLGRRKDALAAEEEALGVYRRLAAQNPQAYAPYLAGSLNNLAAMLSWLGRREEALAAAEEALGLYRRLAEQNPQAYAPDLAMSLNNLGNFLSDLGRREEALAASEEAAGLYRRLTEQNPQAYEPDLAMSLNNLGKFLSDLGRREEALAAAEEAVGVYQRLAEQNPQAYAPDLALSLNNLARSLSDLGRREEALAAAEEAAGLYRRLAEQNPQAYEPDLALSLNNLGKFLSDLGRREEALAAAEEAAGLYRRLAEQNPQAYAPDLAWALGRLGSVLLGLERPAEAFSTFAEGLRILIPHARRLPQAFGPLLRVLLELYLQAAESAGQPSDEALVREAQAVLGTET